MNSTFWNCASFFGSVGTLRLVGADADADTVLLALDVDVEVAAETLEKCLASRA
jgi:hypothetical protein